MRLQRAFMHIADARMHLHTRVDEVFLGSTLIPKRGPRLTLKALLERGLCFAIECAPCLVQHYDYCVLHQHPYNCVALVLAAG